jgi:hypothetical protein
MDEITDTAKIAAANTAAISVSLSDVEIGLRIFSLLLAIAYTLYKFYVTYKKNEQTKQ